MKYLIQTGIITAICFVGEMLAIVLPLPIPGSIYGVILLFTLLCLHIIKPEHICDICDFFMQILPFLFVSPAVKIMTSFDILLQNLIPFIIVLFTSTLAVTIITGSVSQLVIKMRKETRKEKEHESE